jgi:hypothetical protein
MLATAGFCVVLAATQKAKAAARYSEYECEWPRCEMSETETETNGASRTQTCAAFYREEFAYMAYSL